MTCNNQLIKLCFCIMATWKKAATKCFISNVFTVCWSYIVKSNSSSSLKSCHCLSPILTTSNKETHGSQAAVSPPGIIGLSLLKFEEQLGTTWNNLGG